jgi:hypothetical protein
MPEPTPLAPPIGPIIRRATLYGAGLGLIAGLFDRAVLGESAGEVAAIERWRSFILIGAAIGLLLGAAFAWFVRKVFRVQVSGFRKPSDESPPPEP